MSNAVQSIGYQPITMEIEGIEEVQRQLDTLAEDLKAQASQEMVLRTGEAVRDWIKENIRTELWRHPTGALENSVFATVMTNDEGAICYVGPNTTEIPYAMIHEYGGDIYPKRAKALHWVDERGEHFAKHVHIPARPYILPAFYDHQEEILEIMDQVLDEAIAEEIARSGAW